MKPSNIILLTLLICTLSFAVGEESTGVFKFVNAETAAVLEAYRGATGLELIVASNVREAHPITLKSKSPTTANEAARLIEEALLEQAAVIVTRLNDKQASVTYNDKLKIHSAPDT